MSKFIKGMDISMVKELEQYGASYRLNGKKEDLFAILKTCGTNNVRIRIWPDPYDENGNSYGGGGNDLETTIEIAERTVQSGMDFMLDFHYSDFWADPAKQVKPKAWKELSGEALETAVYLHTVDTLKALKNHKLVPTMVQVGNEITKGLLWPDGYIEQTENMACDRDAFFVIFYCGNLCVRFTVLCHENSRESYGSSYLQDSLWLFHL